jgi:hypothetical protein
LDQIIMKKAYIVLLFIGIVGKAQTGIGTTTPEASAKLDISSTNKGLLPPRITLTSRTDNSTIPSPATGLLVYNTGSNPNLVAGYYYWNGSSWATIATATGSGVSSSYVRGSRTTAQTTGLSTNGLVVFTQVDQSAGQDISLNTSTGQITLAAGRTYRLQAQVPTFQTSASDARPQFGWYNETTGAYIGSSSAAYSGASTAGYGATGGLSDAVITTTTPTVISYRIIQTFNTNQLGANGDFSSIGSYPWFNIQVISGNLPIDSNKLTGRVTAGTFLTFENLKFSVTTSGQRGLSIATVTGTVNLYVEGRYNNGGVYGSRTDTTITYSTSPSGSPFGWGFNSAGDTIVYHLTDADNSRMYRVTLIIMPSYINNFISIERLI